MRILAIDFGEKRVGVAVSDPLGYTAQALPSHRRIGGTADFIHFKGICESKKVIKCIVGLPLRMDGQIGPKAREVLTWVEELRKHLPCEVETWDERLTSKEATRLMIAQGLSRQKQKEKSDELAAILILQSYLDHHRSPA